MGIGIDLPVIFNDDRKDLGIWPSTAPPLILPEQLLLLYLDDDLAVANNRQVNYFLIAATLAELFLFHRLEYQAGGTIHVHDTTPVSHAVLDATLKFICSLDISEARRRVSYKELQDDDLYIWIELLQRDLLTGSTWPLHHINQFWKFVAHSLSLKGILTEKENTGWLFKTKGYEFNGFTEKRTLLNAVRKAVSSRYAVDDRMAHLISLVYKSDELCMSGNLRSRSLKIIPPDESDMWKEKYYVLSNELVVVKKIGEAAAHVIEIAELRGSLMPPPMHG
jgi:hypothetical protein